MVTRLCGLIAVPATSQNGLISFGIHSDVRVRVAQTVDKSFERHV